MDPIKKLKNKRGTTLVEVILVVALITIMLGIAMPDILAESEEIKMTALNGYARSVAVAVQSKLYGMKNKGTKEGSEFYMLDSRAKGTTIETDEGKKEVKYFMNFGEDKDKNVGLQILSGALTDTEVLKNGKIVVVYSPETADVVEVFYAENDFSVTDNSNLFPTVIKSYLDQNHIGLYRGDPKPEIEYNIGLPSFSVEWCDDDEKYLQLTMTEAPATELRDKPLGMEVYALIPTDTAGKFDPLLIYAEGLVASNYTATKAENGVLTGSKTKQEINTIESETLNPLTLQKIEENDGKLRFAIDSMVIGRAMYDDAIVKGKLYRQVAPDCISAAESVLYPRDSVDHWLNGLYNPYISFGIDAGLYEISDSLESKVFAQNTKVTDYVKPNEYMKLRVKLYVLDKDEESGNITATIIKKDDGSVDGSRYVADEKYAPRVIESDEQSPYFFSFSNKSKEVALASVRDLQNLQYVFEKDYDIIQARLYRDIDVQQLHDKLVVVRYALIAKDPNVESQWTIFSNADNLSITSLNYVDGGDKGFTIIGTNSKNGGCYAIKNVQNDGATWGMGGFIQYAKNVTVKDLDIVNPKVWKINYKANFIEKNDKNDKNKITGINIEWDNGVSGGLFGVAENCTFTNVHCYNDASQIFKQEPFDAKSYQPQTWLPAVMSARYIGGSVAGGLVGIAIGTNGKMTKFTNCGASAQINSYYYGAMAQCVYAGGLVGIAMGNVTIENSYAACQLSGYYSGGLVGAVAEGPFKCHVHIIRPGHWFDYQWIDYQYEADYTSSLSGTLTIENSFSAGHIQRQTRVGGGLIAQTNGATIKAENCYSASVWEILPPIAYGTFEGDTTNYYLVQNEINVPITLNTEARFTRTAGDVFSLSGKSNGVAVTEETLKNMTGWTAATRTLQWWNKDNSGVPTFLLPTDAETGSGENISTPYPFPMPSGNTKFWGDWNKDNATKIAGDFTTTLDGFYCVYFKRLDDGYQRFIDASAVLELRFTFSGNTTELLSKTIKNSVTKPEDIWWADNKKVDPTTGDVEYGTGVAGMTEVTANGTNVIFTGAAYYNKSYDPTKGYTVDKYSSEENGSRYINWDYYGWYVSNGLFRIGYLSQSGSGGALSNSDFTVGAADFINAVGYREFKFKQNEKKTQIVYKDGYFQVEEAK